MSTSTWQRVTRRHPCPVCHKPDWCSFTGEPGNPTAVICARTESPKRCGEAGWLHVLRNDGPTWAPWRRTIHLATRMMSAAPALNLANMAAKAWAAAPPAKVERLAASLGLAVSSLNQLGIGWFQEHRAWGFPMKDAGGNVLGIRLRLPGGKKLSIKGGKEGLFVPEGRSPHPNPLPEGEGTNGLAHVGEGTGAHGLLLVAEGPTDTAALLDLGFHAVGRPSCTGGVKLLVDFAQRWKPSGVVIVADADSPGQRGAESLAAVLLAYVPAVKIISPPAGIKDARQWKQSGATAADVQAAIDAAPVRKLTIGIRCKQRKGR